MAFLLGTANVVYIYGQRDMYHSKRHKGPPDVSLVLGVRDYKQAGWHTFHDGNPCDAAHRPPLASG